MGERSQTRSQSPAPALKLAQHDRYDCSPLTERKDYSWPGGRRLAFCLTTNIAVHAFGKGRGHDNAKHGEPQTQRNYSWRDYGNRIGICLRARFDAARRLRAGAPPQDMRTLLRPRACG